MPWWSQLVSLYLLLSSLEWYGLVVSISFTLFTTLLGMVWLGSLNQFHSIDYVAWNGMAWYSLNQFRSIYYVAWNGMAW